MGNQEFVNFIKEEVKRRENKKEDFMENINKYFITLGEYEKTKECDCEGKCEVCKCKGEDKGMRIKYFDGAKELVINEKGNCIDVYANKDVFVPYMGYAMIPLGFALELPKGYIGKLYPRSSTFKTWGVIQTNSVGIIDDTYIGDNDQWHMPVQCTLPKETIKTIIEGNKITIGGTWIRKGDKIAQFEIVKAMDMPNLIKVESFGNEDRNGFGSTGIK